MINDLKGSQSDLEQKEKLIQEFKALHQKYKTLEHDYNQTRTESATLKLTIKSLTHSNPNNAKESDEELLKKNKELTKQLESKSELITLLKSQLESKKSGHGIFEKSEPIGKNEFSKSDYSYKTKPFTHDVTNESFKTDYHRQFRDIISMIKTCQATAEEYCIDHIEIGEIQDSIPFSSYFNKLQALYIETHQKLLQSHHKHSDILGEFQDRCQQVRVLNNNLEIKTELIKELKDQIHRLDDRVTHLDSVREKHEEHARECDFKMRKVVSKCKSLLGVPTLHRKSNHV